MLESVQEANFYSALNLKVKENPYQQINLPLHIMVKSTPSDKSWSMSYIQKMKSNLVPSSKIPNMLPLYAQPLKNGLTTAQKPCDYQQ